MKKHFLEHSKGKESVFFDARRLNHPGEKEVENPPSLGLEALPVFANNPVGRLSTGGLISSTSTLNRFSKNVGMFLPLNGNTNELLFLGEIRGI